MRFFEFKPFLTEASEQAGYYTVGDSHAKGIANYAGKPWINKAENGRRSTDVNVLSSIGSIPSGSIVIISLGANDVPSNESPETIANRIKGIVEKASSKGLKPYFVLFPSGTGSDKKRRQEVRSALQSVLADTPIFDLEGSPLVDGHHADGPAYVRIATQVKNKEPLNKEKGEERVQDSSGPMILDIPSSRRGPAVRDVQQALVALGYDVGPTGLDGIRGPYTSGAVMKFQKDNGLKVDGDPGPDTVGKLNDILRSKPEIAKKIVRSTDADVKQYAWSPATLKSPDDPGNMNIPVSGEDISKARKTCEEYAARDLTDDDWKWLVKTLAGESASNAKSYAWCTAVILNRTKNPSKFRAQGNSIWDIVSAPYQFEAVTGRTGHGYHPNTGTANGPTSRQMKQICDGIINELPSIPKDYIGFTATNLSIYGSDKGRQFAMAKMNHPSAVQIAGTVFTTV